MTLAHLFEDSRDWLCVSPLVGLHISRGYAEAECVAVHGGNRSRWVLTRSTDGEPIIPITFTTTTENWRGEVIDRLGDALEIGLVPASVFHPENVAWQKRSVQ